MTPSQLKYHVEDTGSQFFTRSSMRFFGDTMRNYGCRQTVLNGQPVYELYRRRPVKHGLKSSAYFDATTFQRVHPTP